VIGSDGVMSPQDAERLKAGLSGALEAVREVSSSGSALQEQTLADIIFDSSSSLLSADPAQGKSFARTLEVGYGVELERINLKWYDFPQPFGGSDASPEGGFQNLVGRVLEDAKHNGAEVRLLVHIDHILNTTDGIIIKFGDQIFEGRTVIVTIPLAVLKQTASHLFEPPLPPRRLNVISRTHVGVLEKLVLVYPSAWWPNASTTGSFTFLPRIASDPPTDRDAADQAKAIFNSHTISAASFAAPALPRKHPTILFYISSTPAAKLANLPDDAVARGAHALLCERFGATAGTAPSPQAHVRTAWAADPLSRGATSTPVVTGEGRSPLDFIELGKSLWNGKLGFAGEHTDHDHRGSVAGAVVSGQREAERVIKLLRSSDGC
jgi:monoamine oxidase